jgi:4-amino-4-deoxy-L-arabinose transferase-like glycosyltransferase
MDSQTVIAWALVGLLIVVAFPAAAWLARERRILALTLTPGLATGLLSQVMFWEGALHIPFMVAGIVLPYLLMMLPGWRYWFRQRRVFPAVNGGERKQTARLPLLLLSIISLAVLLNAAYWPFYKDDTIGIYARYGKLMFETQTLVPFAGRDDAFYQAYPMHIPLAYTLTYLASGWTNEYLARALPALMSIGTLAGAYLLGERLYGARAGWLAALLLALAPTFGRWASSGYVDLPMAYFYTLAAVFLWQLWEKPDVRSALATGLMLGLAAWTKNAALVGIALAGCWLLYRWLRGRIPLRMAVLAVAVCALVAAPWYARNWLEARLIVPPTAWTEQAQRTLGNLFVFVTEPQNFAFSGLAILISLALAAVRVVQRRAIAVQDMFLLLLTIPFFGVWWLLVSYDPRFLLLFLPPLCVFAAGQLEWLWGALPLRWQSWLRIPLTVLAVGMAVYIAWISVEFKPEMLQNPLMGDAAKHAIVLGSR